MPSSYNYEEESSSSTTKEAMKINGKVCSSLKQVVCSAPGKIIFHGEHAVVYGKKAIAGAIKSRVKVQMSGRRGRKETDEKLTIKFPNITNNDEDGGGFVCCFHVETLQRFYQQELKEKEMSTWMELIQHFITASIEIKSKMFVTATTSLMYAYFKVWIDGGDLEYCDVTIEVISNDLPVGCGLGSSAAFNVATAASILVFSALIPTEHHKTTGSFSEQQLEVINKLGYEMERCHHGNPSGVDNSTATYGGAISYKSGRITRLPKFPQLEILVADSGVARNTKDIVGKVRQQMQQFPGVMEPIMTSIDAISDEQEKLFTRLATTSDGSDKDVIFTRIKKLVEMNQHLLNSIGAGHPALTRIHEIANLHNFACKLTGAGGGGFCLILLHGGHASNMEKLKNHLRREHINFFQFAFGCDGAQLEL